METPGFWGGLSLWVQRNVKLLGWFALVCVVVVLAAFAAAGILYSRDVDPSPVLQFSLFYAGTGLLGCAVLAQVAFYFDPDQKPRPFPQHSPGHPDLWVYRLFVGAQLILFVGLLIVLPCIYLPKIFS